MGKRVEDYVLDPDKFENDFPHRPETQEDVEEGFEDIYEAGLAVPEHSAYYDQWFQWLAANHPDGQVSE